MSTYSSKVRYYRESKGLRQEQLANEIGVCRKTICQIEAEEGYLKGFDYQLVMIFERLQKFCEL